MSAKNAVLFVWKNLLDRRLFRRALAAQVAWAADDVLIGNPYSEPTVDKAWPVPTGPGFGVHLKPQYEEALDAELARQ